MQNVHVKFWQDLLHYCLPWGHWSTVATAYKKVTMITSTHILTLLSLRWKGLRFLLSWINKLNHNFFYRQFFHLFAPRETTWPCFCPISPWVHAKMAGIVNKVYCRIEKIKQKQQNPSDIAPLSTLAGGLVTDVSYSAVGTLYITALTRWQLYWLVQLVKRGGISWGTVKASEFIGKRKSQFTSSIDICVTECKWVDGWYQDKVYSTPPNHFSPPGHAWLTLPSIFIFLHLGACLQAREKGNQIHPSLVEGCH